MGNPSDSAFETNHRDRLRDAIRQWWRGGGGTTTILDVLEREGATDQEARFVAAKLASSSDRLHVITGGVVENVLEMARAHGSAGTTPVDRGWDGERCVFDDDPCPECAAFDKSDEPPIVHGRLLTQQELAERITELRQLLVARHEEMDQDKLRVWI